MTEPLVVDDQLLVTPEEAARRLSVGRTTLYELLSSGALPSVQIGRCRRVPVSALSAFVDRLSGRQGDRRTPSAISARSFMHLAGGEGITEHRTEHRAVLKARSS